METREDILNDCAERLAKAEGEGKFNVDDMVSIMLDRLAETASAEVMGCAKLGRVIMNLNRDIAAETPKGVYGVGKLFRGTFTQIGKAKGRPGTDAQVEEATNNLLDKFVGKIYELAGVDR